LLAAGDTFRAAAIEQLDIWADRTDADIVKHKPGADAASVAFDAIQAAKARQTDVVIIDTAGRLHTKVNLMEEVKKIRRVVDKALPGAPHETLLVLDATTGQNAVNQARQFHQSCELTGLILAKLDGTAKGGVVIAIAADLDLPVRFVGLGEGPDDLEDFVPENFVRALFEK
ncbi:MAG: signal recognition particle-docking protein FtsY, partial [Candidatus Latescibacterota bacterium]